MLGHPQVDARRAQFRRGFGDLLEQRDAFIVPALLQVGQCDFVLGAYVAADTRLLGNREADLFLDLDTRGRRFRRGRCAGSDQRCRHREQDDFHVSCVHCSVLVRYGAVEHLCGCFHRILVILGAGNFAVDGIFGAIGMR